MITAFFATNKVLKNKQLSKNSIRCIRSVYSLCNAVYILYTVEIDKYLLGFTHLQHN
ncbi:hypothetical protein D3C86_884290 [compost metagenome]